MMNRIEFLATYYGKEHQELKTLEEIEELKAELKIINESEI